jgi:hypothetical protein
MGSVCNKKTKSSDDSIEFFVSTKDIRFTHGVLIIKYKNKDVLLEGDMTCVSLSMAGCSFCMKMKADGKTKIWYLSSNSQDEINSVYQQLLQYMKERKTK